MRVTKQEKKKGKLKELLHQSAFSESTGLEKSMGEIAKTFLQKKQCLERALGEAYMALILTRV